MARKVEKSFDRIILNTKEKFKLEACMSKKILFIVAREGFQHTEYATPKKIVTDAGYEVVTATDADEHQRDVLKAQGHDGTVIVADMSLDDVHVGDYAGIVLIGGPGALTHLDNYKVYGLVQEVMKLESRLCAAICISTRILANAGILEGRKVTGWDGDGELQHVLDEAGALYVKAGTVIDRNLVTAVGPAAAKEFGEAIVEAIGKLY